MNTPPATPPANRVSVVDINMPFSSMVVFMVKWAIAAIPALLILAVVGALAAMLMSTVTDLARSGSASRTVTETLRPAVSRTASDLIGLSYAEVVEAAGQPTSQQPNLLIYALANGDTLELRLINSRVSSAVPAGTDLARIVRR